MDEPRRELHLFFAAENSSAVVLYRAKNSLYRLLSWDTNGDKFVPGQWVKTRVFETACALSPDGKYFIYSAMQGGTPDVFTALSIVPFFTALEFRTGLLGLEAGGYFLDRETLTFHHTMSDAGVFDLNCGLKQDTRRQYWFHSMNRKYSGISYEAQTALRDEVEQKRGKIPSLLDCYACDGAKLYRKATEGLTLLLDCSSMQFEAIKAPYVGCSTMSSEQ